MAYLWRQLNEKERASILEWRRRRAFPWHSPPHAIGGQGTYHLTAACLNHEPHIGKSPERMAAFCEQILAELHLMSAGIHAWCVLPNHYHLLVTVPDLLSCTKALGEVHGRTSFQWNGTDGRRGRQVWHGASDRWIRSDRHFWATLNYVHNNPVRHRYVGQLLDWPYSSAEDFHARVGPQEVERVWREYPLEDYGAGWDEPWM